MTGYSGFKGAWMCQILLKAGAEVTGYALEPSVKQALFPLLPLKDSMNCVTGDIRDLLHMRKVFEETRPEIVIHMAAQPIVRESYRDPVYTYDVNVMGTVNILESIRHSDSVRSVINVTTDKVYKNREWDWGYRENEELNGYDPYSNSKSCSELVTESYKNCFFNQREIAVSTMRAGNVIGGGDFAQDRIIPDCVRAAKENRVIIVRNPDSIRPYQHVLEAVMAYLMVAERQYNNKLLAGSYNIGPEERDCWATGRLVALFCQQWKELVGNPVMWESGKEEGPHEAGYLKLDCSKIKSVFGWKTQWNIERAVRKTIEWSQKYLGGESVAEKMDEQIDEFVNSFS